MNAEIVSIGTELLLGEITDTNATWIARQLRDIGVNLFFVTAVGDNLGRITDTLKRGLERSDLVITTGGLGPTVDDMTREGVAKAVGRDLIFQQHLLDQIAERFSRFGSQMTENNRQQAFVPEGAIIVENPVGTAPCFIVESEQGTILSLPGVPREMKYLMENHILPYLKEKMGLPAIIKARVLHTAGIGESFLDNEIGDFMREDNPTVGLAAHSGQTDIRITARAETVEEADALIGEMENKIRAKVGEYVYGVDADNNLLAVLAKALEAQNRRLNICEMGTDGSAIQQLRTLSEVVLGKLDYYPQASRENGESLTELGTRHLEDITSGRDVGLAVLLDGEGNGAMITKTPEKVRSRELKLGAGDEATKWALQWGMGYLWRYLAENN